jgi:hypothetical protein
MVPNQETKVTDLLPPAAAVNNASFAPSSLDCKDWDYASVHLLLGATDIALTALKLQESDDNATWTDVVGTRFGTDTDMAGNASTLPSATDDNHVFVFDVDCRSRKRYLKPVISVGAGTTGAFAAVLALQSRGAIAPHDPASRGVTGVMRV